MAEISGLLRLLDRREDLRPLLLSPELLGIVGLWRLRGVCRVLRQWGSEQLAALPRVVALGGSIMVREHDARPEGHAGPWPAGALKGGVATASVGTLDPETLRWHAAAGSLPPLPIQRNRHTASSFADGRVVLCGGSNTGHDSPNNWMNQTALQWTPGNSTWTSLLDMPTQL